MNIFRYNCRITIDMSTSVNISMVHLQLKWAADFMRLPKYLLIYYAD